jgi:hypothetical protein
LSEDRSMCGACYKCKHRRNVPGDAHSTCANKNARVKGVEHGVKSGWFMWPFNFDPVWLISCDGFEAKE